MRITALQHLTAVPDQPLTFAGARGERFHIEVLDHDLIRIRHWPDGAPRLDRTWLVVGSSGDTPREGRARADLSPFPCPAFELRTTAGTIDIHTERLALAFDLADPRITWFTPNGQIFAADLRLRAYSSDRSGQAVYHYLERRPDEHYYGFGERAGPLDKRGQRLHMKNVDALGYNAETSDPLYKHYPFYITYIPTLKLAYGLFYDNLATTTFDLGKEIDAFWGHYRFYQADGGDLDYYMIFGPEIEAVIEKFTRLVGRPALPPRWSLGYLGSTMTYTEAADAQDQLKRFAELCAEHDIPCDLFHLSSGYTTDAAGRRCVFTWNRSRIPDPAGMTRAFHEAGIRLAANIKPYLLTVHPDYQEVAARGGFIRDPDSDQPALSRFWSGGPFESGAGAYIDFTSAAGFDWWKARIHAALFDFGIDAAWNDNNEFELWDDEAVCDGFGRPLPMRLARPLHTLLMARASYEATLERSPERRPFVLSRSGCPGIQRYAQSWSGDNETSWHTLRWNIPMGLGMGLSGAPNIGHDVGGFYGPAPDAELLVRWVQNGIFHPRFTIHSWNTDGTVNEPWMHPEVLPIIRAAFRFRYRLLPYLYTLFFEAHRSGHPIIRPLVYHFPDDPRCATESFDFLLGPTLLVASVLEPGARTRTVYLPSGTSWCDFHSGQWYAGGQTVTVPAPLDRCPLFVRAGGLIPLGKPMRHIGHSPDDVREVHVFAREGVSEFTLIEDDGESFDYQRGGYSAVLLRVEVTPDGVTASAHRTHAGFALPYGQVTFILALEKPQAVVSADWRDGRWHLTVPVT